MKRVLITGASGFIGWHCLEPLKARGYEVHAIAASSHSEGPAGVTWHRANLLDAASHGPLLEGVQPTHLLHLAWYVVPGQLIHAAENFDWVTASLGLVRRFAERGGTRAVTCGTCYEYDWSHGYCNEAVTPTAPDTVYGHCKNALHELVRTFGATARLSTAWGRVFFLYGPREHPQRLVSSIVRALLRGEEAKTSHGRQVRDYLHVQDVAGGLVALLDSDRDGAYNVCSGEARTLRSIIERIGVLTGRSDLLRVGAIPARANDTSLVVGARERAERDLDWRPAIDLDDGLRRTIDWWTAHPDGV